MAMTRTRRGRGASLVDRVLAGGSDVLNGGAPPTMRTRRAMAKAVRNNGQETDGDGDGKHGRGGGLPGSEEERLSCDFFDTRHGFLRMCQTRNF